jgi:WD40 repeat protein
MIRRKYSLGLVAAVIVTVCAFLVLVMYRPAGVKPRLELTPHESYVTAVAFSPDGALVASGSVNFSLWDPKTGIRKAVLGRDEYGGVSSIAFTQDSGRLVTASGLGAVKVWDLSRQGTFRTLFQNLGDALGALSPTAPILAVNYGQDLCLWDVDAGKRLRVVESKTDAVTWAFSPDGTILAAAFPQGHVRVWNIDSEAAALDVDNLGEDFDILRVRIAPSQDVIAIDGYHWGGPEEVAEVILWDLGRNAEVKVLTRKGRIQDIAFSPNGRVLALARGNHVELVNVESGEISCTLAGDRWRGIICLAFSPDGTMLAAGTTYTIQPLHDAKLLIWDVPVGRDAVTAK